MCRFTLKHIRAIESKNVFLIIIRLFMFTLQTYDKKIPFESYFIKKIKKYRYDRSDA